MMLDTDTADIGPVRVEAVTTEHVTDLLRSIPAAQDAAAAAGRKIAEARREVAGLLHQEGLPMRDVGWILGISHQRVSQILR